jgi:hypothetical protein
MNKIFLNKRRFKDKKYIRINMKSLFIEAIIIIIINIK